VLFSQSIFSDMASRSNDSRDASVAVELNKEYSQEENTKKEDKLLLLKSALSIVSPDWETLDPNPDIQVLFQEFNERFFDGKLIFCTLEWTKNMELGQLEWAGKCEYQEQYWRAHISLSEQILKRRPRKDTVETLLHEMIHAYVFMTRQISGGHDSEFLFHMDRINKETGASITVHHGFLEEVDMVMSDIMQDNDVTVQQGFVEEVDMVMSDIMQDNEDNDVNEEISNETESILKHVETEKNNEILEENHISDQVIEELHKPCIACNAFNDNDAEEAKVENVSKEDLSRIRFLLFNGRSTTKHFHPDSTLEEVYKIAQTLMIPGTSPSLSSRYPSLSLDTVPRDQTLRELGLVSSATIMVVPGTEHQDQDTRDNSFPSPKAVIMVIFLACLLGFLGQHPAHQDYQKIDPPTDLTGSVLDLSHVLRSRVGGFARMMYAEKEWYYVFGYIILFLVVRSMWVGLPYGRLVWVGRYDHN